LLRYFATVLLIGLRDYGTARWEGGSAECDHSQKLGGTGSASAKQVTSGGTQTYQYKGQCPKCGAVRVDGQIGLEPTPEEFIARLVEVFREVRRVLKDDGTCWIVIGDSYAGAGYSNHSAASGFNAAQRSDGGKQSHSYGTGAKNKDLLGIPWMLAFALRADGWYLRSEVIWHKLNPMPESVTDRPTKAHEQIFLLSKSQSYFYDHEAIREPQAQSSKERALYGWNGQTDDNSNGARTGSSFRKMAGNGDLMKTIPNDGLRNKRSVWTIPTKGYSEAHFACYPPALIEPCILAGSRPGDTVLDPFGGSGTTAEVANKFGRKAVLIELNREYCELIMRRNRQATIFAEMVA